jgi:hypothetical protein
MVPPAPAAAEVRMKIRTTAAFAIATLALTPGVAAAESQQDQIACMGDAFSVCGHAIPDRDRVAACLAQNIDRISLACRAVMQRHTRLPVSRDRMTLRN